MTTTDERLAALDDWKRHAEYLCRGTALTNAKNQALRVLQLIEYVSGLLAHIERLETERASALCSACEDGYSAASVMQDDLRDLLDVLGLFSGARPQTPHAVMREAITEVRRRVAHIERLEAVVEAGRVLDRVLHEWVPPRGADPVAAAMPISIAAVRFRDALDNLNEQPPLTGEFVKRDGTTGTEYPAPEHTT